MADVCAFATDQAVSQDDHRQLEAAVAGELGALITTCTRFELPLLAAATRATGTVATAVPLLEPTLSTLSAELLDGQLAPHDWSRRALQLIADQADQVASADRSAEETEQTLSAIGSIPRVARRRAIREAVPQLSLPELTALLIHHYRNAAAAEMVGLTADTEAESQQFLEQAFTELRRTLTSVAEQVAASDDAEAQLADDSTDRSAELEPTLQSVLESDILPTDLGQSVASKAFAKRFGSSFSRPPTEVAPATRSLPWLIVAALAGALVGYVVLPSQSSGFNAQIALAQLMGNRGLRGNPGLGLLSNPLLPASTETFRVLFLVFLILFVTRSQIWTKIYPARLPVSLVVTQWLALIASLFGVARVALGTFVALAMFSGEQALTRGPGEAGVLSIGLLVDQLWWLCFWLAALAIIFFLASLWAQFHWRSPATES